MIHQGFRIGHPDFSISSAGFLMDGDHVSRTGVGLRAVETVLSG